MAKRFVVRVMIKGNMEIDQPTRKTMSKKRAIKLAESCWMGFPKEDRENGDSYACVLRADLDDDFDNYVEAVETAEEIWIKDEQEETRI